MTTRFIDHLITGDHASRPAANAVPQGTLYSCTDHDKIYQSDGSAAWTDWAVLTGTAPGAHAADHETGGSDPIDLSDQFVPESGGTFTGDISVPDDAYDATTWNGNAEVPTKNAIRDKIESLGAGASVVVQVVNTQTGAVATGATTTPWDDTIPQNTEGNEFMTRAITPTSATNILRIDVVFYGTSSAAPRNLCVALHQDSVADALAAGYVSIVTAAYEYVITFTHYMLAGTTSATTFKVRAGVETSGTITFNGSGGVRRYGGVMASSITITEITP